MKEISLQNDTAFQQRLIGLNALIPALLVAWDWKRGQLGANPVEFVTRMTGVMALLFLVITLLVTPLRKLCGWNWLLKLRRNLGLYAFYYGICHLATYLIFDRNLKLLAVPADVWKRPFIAVGMIAFLLMIPLAVTSTNAMIKRLGGKNWQQLHRFVYVIAIGGVVHYWWLVKKDVTQPQIYAAVLALLLGIRLVFLWRKHRAATDNSKN